MHRVRKTEGEWCFASKGVTTEDPEVQHGTTGWTDSLEEISTQNGPPKGKLIKY